MQTTRATIMTPLQTVKLSRQNIYPQIPSSEIWMEIEWKYPIQFFVGRNGSRKTRTATALAQEARSQGIPTRFLSTDRLAGLMFFNATQVGSIPLPQHMKGTALGESEEKQAKDHSLTQGTAHDALITMREFPDVALRLEALLRRAFGRRIRLVEASGFVDPMIEHDGETYSLLRDEGHGLRELVILLINVYRPDWNLLVIDEPELHLHPSLTRLCLTELENECAATNRHAVLVTRCGWQKISTTRFTTTRKKG
jgi:hypothetical protein